MKGIANMFEFLRGDNQRLCLIPVETMIRDDILLLSLMFSNTTGGLHDVIVNVLDFDIVGSEFELQPHYNVHLGLISLKKV